MRDFQRRFAVHADTIEAESAKAYASSQNISGPAGMAPPKAHR
jgi:hypothetical protein